MSEWVRVEEELPEFHKQILFVFDGIVEKGMFLRSSHKFISYDKYTELKAHKSEVTHWMLLPEPPKE